MRRSLHSAQPSPSPQLLTVMNSCLSLQADLDSSWRQARFSAFDSIAVLQNAKKDLYRPPPTTWKEDPKYQKVRTKIRDLHGSQTERSIREGAYTDRPWASSLLDSVEELRFQPRPFGQQRTVFKPETAVKVLRRPSTLQEMDIFWRSEITKYNSTRNSRLIPATPKPKLQEKRAESSADVRNYNAGEGGCSSLQRFILNYGQLRQLHPDQFQENLRMKKEAKMSKIKPSPEVLKLSEKYLPKHFKRLQPAKQSPNLKQLAGRLQLPDQSKPYSLAFLFDTPEEDIMRDMQRECEDRDHIFHVEKILNKRVPKGKSRRLIV